jgi:hypothetical protein
MANLHRKEPFLNRTLSGHRPIAIIESSISAGVAVFSKQPLKETSFG